MSLYSWSKEFYPVKASKVHMSKATEHSLRKWEGMRPENLEKHGLRVSSDGYAIQEKDDLSIKLGIDDSSCALCYHYVKENCIFCPLAIVRGGCRCDLTVRHSINIDRSDLDANPRLSDEDKEMLLAEERSPYQSFSRYSDPEPMIFWLKRADQL